MECKTKSSLPPNIFIDSEIKCSKSSIDVASAAITFEPVFYANLSISPILIATGAFDKTKVPPSS